MPPRPRNSLGFFNQSPFLTPDTSSSGIRLVAGLGNPGREYEGTRHNIGFAVIDRIASLLQVECVKEPKWRAFIAKGASGTEDAGLTLIKPTTFMNLSGEAVVEYARFFRIPSHSTLVIVDDIALPLGALRLRVEGGSGGQKGLESVLMHFATEQVPRLRVGIGGATAGDLSSHVLSRFLPEEQSAASEAVNRAAEATLCVLRKGLLCAMNLYNAAPSSAKTADNTEKQP